MDRTTFAKKYKLADFTNEVTNTSAAGTSFTGYADEKAFWQGELVDAARQVMYFMDAVDVRTLPEKQFQYVVNYRKYYPTGASVSWNTTEFTDSTSQLTNYGTNLVDGVVITPTPYSQAAVVTNYAEYHNLRDLLRDKMDELSYALSDKIDNMISLQSSTAVAATSTASGAMTIYGGTATSDSTLAAGCVLTPSLINKADVLLNGKYAYYWNSTTFTKSSGVKNPWRNEPTDPFVLIIGQRQKQALRDSGQFVNAAQYGDRVVISSGEIGDYLGIRVICSNNVQTVASGASASAAQVAGASSVAQAGGTMTSGTCLDGSGTTASVDMTRCLLMKGRAAYTFVWGRTPRFEPWEKAWADMRGITLVCDFAGSVVHADAFVYIDVSDN